jgi:hypothetical protein
MPAVTHSASCLAAAAVSAPASPSMCAQSIKLGSWSPTSTFSWDAVDDQWLIRGALIAQNRGDEEIIDMLLNEEQGEDGDFQDWRGEAMTLMVFDSTDEDGKEQMFKAVLGELTKNRAARLHQVRVVTTLGGELTDLQWELNEALDKQWEYACDLTQEERKVKDAEECCQMLWEQNKRLCIMTDNAQLRLGCAQAPMLCCSCSNPTYKTLVASCGHGFCRTSIKRQVATDSRCPVCHIVNWQYARHLDFEGIVGQLNPLFDSHAEEDAPDCASHSVTDSVVH